MATHQTSILFIVFLWFSMISFGQDNILTYDLNKGEAFDILLVTTKPASQDTFKEYREKAFPVAIEMGYSFLPGFKIVETTQGNNQPTGFILGKWQSISKREQFLKEIDTRVPDFHKMRKKIWSLFDLTYYEIKENSSFQLDKSKIIVFTAYWKQDGRESGFESYILQWKEITKQSGGSLVIELTDGHSPFGYYYNPDYVVISQWDNREDFEAFLKKNLDMDTQALKNVNQFILGE